MYTTAIRAMAFLPHGSEEDIREAAVSREAPSEEAPSEEEAAEGTSECESLTKGKCMFYPLPFSAQRQTQHFKRQPIIIENLIVRNYEQSV